MDDNYQIQEANFSDPVFALNGYRPQGNRYRLANMRYDPNGNIQTLRRFNGTGQVQHDFAYTYKANTNQLQSVSGHASYAYNAIGQMIKADKTEEGADQYVDYDVTGKVVAVYKDANRSQPVARYAYDDRGFRMAKISYSTAPPSPGEGTGGEVTTWYIRDAGGNILSIYEQKGIGIAVGSGAASTKPPVQKEVPVYGSGKLGTYYPAHSQLADQAGHEAGSTAYEITDHLGNVRALLRTHVNEYTATLEDDGTATYTNPRVRENVYFKNLWTSEKRDAQMNHTGTVVTPAPDRSAYLRWVGGQAGMDARQKSVGPAIALAVKAGDRVQLSAWARFKSSEAAFSKTPISGIIASALAGQYAYSNGLESTVQAANAFNAGLLGLANPSEDADDGRPYAYLNYIVFNSSYAKVDGGAKRVPQGAGFTEAQRANGYGPNNLVKFDKAVEISQPGYIYIWVSNESENTEVWFDDINVIHQKTLIAQATDYETWGGVLREQKWEDMEGEYRYGYQGKYAEKDEETGWEHFELREYDPVIGRWMVRDPRRQYWSPYLAMGNNPMNRVDPTGGTDGPDPKDGSLNKAGTHTWDSKTKGWVKTLDEVVVTAKSGFNWKAAPVPQDATRFVIARVPPGINPSREKIGRGGVNITGEGARPDGFNAGRNIGGNRTIAEEEWSIYDWMAALFSNYQSTNNGSDQIIDANQLLHHEAHGNPATPQIDTVYTGTVYFTSTLNTNTRLGNYIKRFGINRSTGDTIKLDPKQLDPSVYPSGSSYPK